MRVRCSECDEEHDLEEVEPRYGLPDEVFALDEDERAARVRGGTDWCVLREARRDDERFFVRALVPFAVAGRAQPFHWGVWVELSGPAFAEVRQLWSSERQLTSGPWGATLANGVSAYPSTLGLPGLLRFVDTRQLPRFSPLAEQHPFATDFEAGLSEQRWVELQLAHLHGRPTLRTSRDEEPHLVDCAEHGRSIACVVCTHLLHAAERSVGFIENSSDPQDLQAWCDDCEQLFEREGEMTEDFRQFNDMRLVCSVCYELIKQRHSPIA